MANEPKAYELIPNTPKHRYVVLLGDGYAIAEERSPINYHVAGYFPIKDEIPFAYIRFAFMLDSGALIYNSPVKWVGGLRKCMGFRGRSRADQCHRPLPLREGSCDGRARVHGMQSWHLFSHWNGSFPQFTAHGSACAKIPDWLKDQMRKSPDELLWAMVPDSEVAHLRNCTIARNVAEDHRKVAFFGGIVIKAVDCTLSDEVKQRFRARVRGPMMGAIRFDISIERLVSAITGPKSDMMVGAFMSANEHFRRYDASLFLNCREKPLNSYLFYSRHVRTAYLLAVSNNEISPLFSREADIAEQWNEMVKMHDNYSRYMIDLRTRFRLSSTEVAMQFFRGKITDQTPQYSVCLSLEYEKLQDWLNKTVYNVNSGAPSSSNSEIMSDVQSGSDESAASLRTLIPLGPLRSPLTRFCLMTVAMTPLFRLTLLWMRLHPLSICCTGSRAVSVRLGGCYP